jgi:hypothetical protein
MARYYINCPLWDSKFSRFGGISETNADARAIELRDAFRVVLDPDGLHTNWIVSDVLKWQTVNSNSRSYAFIVYHRDTGSNTGHAWIYVIPGYVNNTITAELEESFQSNQLQNYFRNTTNTISFGVDGPLSVFYSPLGGTSDPFDTGIDLNTGDLPSGDLDTPTTNPFTNLVTFMPSTPIYGVNIDTMSTTYDYSHMTVIADDAKPFLATYSTQGQDKVPTSIIVQGNVIAPYRPTDVETFATLNWKLNWSSNVEGSSSTESMYCISNTGSRLELETFYNNIFTIQNVPLADDSYPWDVILLANSTDIKGWIDSDIVRVMGAFNAEAFSLYNLGNFIKLHEAFCFPYVPDTVVWPLMPGS